MTTFLSTLSGVSFSMKRKQSTVVRFGLILTCVVCLMASKSFAQTTYTWNGGTAAWNVSTNWTPTRTTPAATDILQFNDGGSYVVSAVPAQTIRQLFVTGNTNVTLQSAGTTTLSVNGPALTNNIVVGNGSVLELSATNALTLSMITTANQRADISGTLNVRGGTFTTSAVGSSLFTVAATGIINHYGGTITSSAATLSFDAGSNYNYLVPTGTLAIPTATWNTTSNANITGITTGTVVAGFSGQSFGNFTYGSPSQTVTTSLQNAATTTTIKGNFTISNTGSGAVSLGIATGTLTVNGELLISGGTLDLCSGATSVVTTLNLDGNYNQTAGALTRSNAANVSPINFRGSSATYTQSGGTVTNTYINYNLNFAGAALTLNSGIVLSASRSFTVTNGILYCGTNVISGAGTFTLAAAATATLGIGDPNGITPQASGTGGTAGNIRTTTRTFNTAANYIYTGTNGQVTGTGLQATVTGYVQIDMQNNSDALTFSNTALSGNGVNVRMKKGVIGNAITYTNATNSILTYEGLSGQTTTNNEFPAVSGPRSLVINNTSGVTLHAARSLGNGATNSLTLTNGILNTTGTNVLTIASTSVAAVSGGSATSYVNGPLIRSFNTTTGTYNFPVGKAAFGELDLILGTSPGGATTYQVEYFEATPSGSIGAGLSALGDSYWRVQRLSGTGSLSNIGVTITKSGIVTDSRIGFSPDNAATAYINIGGTGPASSITSSINTTVTADGYYTVGTGGTLSGTITAYTTLTSISNALNTMLVTGDVIFELPTTYAGEPAYPVTFGQFNTNGSPWTVTIRPAAGSPVLLTAGDPGTGLALIELDAVDRLTFDGRAGGAGSTVGWIFRNTRTAALVGATFRFLDDATYNTLTYIQAEGQNVSGSGGTIFFSTSPSGTLGNSNNTISYCEVRDRVTGGTALPLIGIYSAGTTTAINANNTISNCSIYNYHSNATTTTSAGIRIDGSSTAWTIQNNKFFQTGSRVTAAVQPISAIYINNTSANNFTITNNYIGGDNASGTGTSAYTSTAAAQAAMIYLNIGTTPASLVSNNTISNISFTTISGGTANWGVFSAIYLAAGSARILNNTVGASSGTGSISVTVNTNSGAIINAIKSDATGTVKIENNTIGSITATGTGTNNAVSLYGINFSLGNVAAKNNNIGSLITPNSLQVNGTASSNSSILAGINATASASYTDSLLNNQIVNLRNNNVGTGTRVVGIAASSGAQYIIDNNTVYKLSTPGANVGTTTSASVIGISLNTANTQALSLSGNLVHSLVNGSAANTSIIGIYYSGGSSAHNRVDRNFVHTFNPSTGATSSLIGLQLAATVTASNNMVRLGIQPGGTGITQSALMYGIDLTTTSGSNIFHNSVYLTGAVAGVTATNTFAFRRTATSGSINIQNNIFVNTRTQASGGKHYAIYTPNITGFTSDYNVLYANGTGTYTGLFAAADALTLANWRTATTNRDLNSLACDPNFIDENGDESNVDLHIDGAGDTPIEGRGSPVDLSPSITVDFDGTTRDIPATNTVDIGADAGNFTPRRSPSLSPTANGSSPLSTCVNAAVTFAAVPSGGATCGAWEYSWYNGINYWNGTTFASATEVFNTGWENINVPSLATGGTITVKVRCSGDTEGCIAPQQSTVNVTLNGATTLSAAIGNPANGLNHNINLSWTAAAGVSGYEVEYSTDNASWNPLYSGTNLSYVHNTGDSPNAPYYYKIRSVFGATSCNWINATQFPIYTAADAPALPTLNNPTPYTLDLAIANEAPVVNPAITTYSIFCSTNNLYVQANGSLGATEVFQTKANWATVTVTGLIPSTNYCFYAKARNQDGDVRVAPGTITPDICLSTAPLLLSGDYTVGAGGDFLSLTNPGGLFETVNLATLSGNVTATIISDLTSESGTHALEQWPETGAGNYTLTIRPSNNTQRVISGNYVGASAALAGLYRIDGADRAIFDGRDPSNIAAGGKYLLFRNQSATSSAFNSTFNFINDAQNDTLRYVIVEGATLGTTNGVVRFSTATTTGNDNILIDNSIIRDRSDVAGIPINAIYALGTNSALNSGIRIANNEIYNFWNASSSSNGIYVNSGNTDWTISGNSFYQTASRAAAGTVNHYAVQVDNSTNGNNFQITNNYIGGTAASAGGTAWTITGTAQVGFVGISVNALGASTNLVQGNTVANFSIASSKIAAFPLNVFTGILSASNGATTINNNTVGSDVGNGSISINNVTSTGALVVGIGHNTSSGDVTITNNKVGSFTITSGGSLSVSFNGIRYGQGGSSSARTISNNLIGSLVTANSINVNTASSNATAQDVIGINMISGANAVSITDNIIANLNNNRPVTGTGQVIGINSTTAPNTITGNTIYNLTTSSNNTSTGSSSSVVGILLSATLAGNHTVSQNTIYALKKNSGTSAVSVTGIYYGGSAGSTNQVSRNLIHSLSSTGTSSIVNGIYLGAGSVTASNNFIRLGIDETGSSITAAIAFQGIVKDNTSSNNFIYYNSVYIGGTGVATTAANSIAFRRAQTSSTDNVRNNIFYNARSNATTGGKHYGVYLNAVATLIEDYNIILANGTGGVFASIAGTDHANITAWRGATPYDDNSISADPQFLSPTAATPNLHLNTAVASLAESGAIAIAGLTDDFDALNIRTGYPLAGQVNGGGTSPDIGADEGDFIPIDLTAPSFTYTNIATQALACPPYVTTVNVTINDGQSGISLTNNLPRMYFRKSVGAAPGNTWSSAQFVEGTLVSGTPNISEWQFTLTYSAFGIVPAASDVIEYYFVAQDLATTPNVGFSQTNGTTPQHTPDVAGSSVLTFPGFSFGATGTYGFVSPISGTVNVGSGQTYTSLNAFNSTGLFFDLMNRGISSDIEVLITSDLNESGLYNVLGAIPEYCGAGYTVTIKPSAGTLRTIYQTAGGNPLINLQGCQRIIFDGSFGGSGRFLTFAARQNTPTFYFNGVNSRPTSDIQIKNCTVEGNNTLLNSVGPGVINFAGLLGTGSSIENITIDNNIIRNRSDLTQNVANSPASLIHAGPSSSMDATNNPVKSNITISNNEMFNFSESAIQIRQNSLGNGIGNNITISGNKIYEPITYNTYQYPIWLDGGVNSSGNKITNNLIGGNASPSPAITGTWTNSKGDGEVVAINTLNGGTSLSDGIRISGNTIANIAITGQNYTNFIGIRNEYGYAKIISNTVNNIANNGGGSATDITANTATIGIWNQDENEAVIDSNIISNFSNPSINKRFLYMVGIQHGSNQYHNGADYTNYPGGKVSIKNNQVFNLSCASGLQSVTITPDALIGIFSYSINGTTGNEISDNQVYSLNATLLNVFNTKVYGIGVGLGGAGSTQSGVVARNKIYDLNNSGGGANIEVNGLVVAGGNWNVNNNMISITNADYPTIYPFINGINDWMESGRTGSFHNNTVYIGGTVGAGGANSSYAYVRLPDATGLVQGSNVSLRNNIFLNDRTGNSTNNVAIANFTQGNSADAAVGWNSNYNFLLTRNVNQVGRWVGTAAGDRNFTNWKTTSNGDASSWSVAAAASSSNTQLNFADLFIDAPNGNLNINPANQASWFVNGKGVAGSVSADLSGDARTTTYGYGIDIGADEFTPNGGVLPHALTATPVASGTNNFSFAGRNVGSITWGAIGALPTTITARYFSGDEPGTTPSPSYGGATKTDFMLQYEPTGGSGYTYNATLNYDDALLGNYVIGEGNLKMIKTLSSTWIDVTSSVDSVNNVLTTSSALSSFSFFSGGVSPNPLPIELLSFDANCAGDRVKLNWSTATEINNEHFTIHRSADLMNWEEIITISGAGNSNQIRNYETFDDRPLDGLAYYKLSQHDYDGTSESFDAVSVNCYSDGSGNMMSVYPNPATDNFTVSVTIAEDIADAVIIITDVNGKNILQRNINLVQGTTELGFDTQGFNLGTYIVQVKSNGVILKPVKLIIQ